jgi:tripartite-type tricarboxylate transporter receptor subunit TctC
MSTALPRALRVVAAIAATLPAFIAAPAAAQSDWPSRPIVVVLAIGAGSGTDLGLRLYAAHLSRRLNQQVVVENRPGASTILGTEYGMRQQPNGYNLTSLFSTSTIVPSTHKNVAFDPIRDFMPIARMAASEYGFAVHPSVPVKNLQELVVYAKANPGKLTHASPGHGTPHHLGIELFKLNNGVEMLHVPHKSITDALNTVVGGHTHMILSVAAGLAPFTSNGRMRMIAITGDKAVSAFPGVQTVRDQGMPYLDSVRGWFGLAAPLKTPQAVIMRMNAEINAIAKQPEFIADLAKSGQVPTGGTPEDLTALMKNELETWARVVRDAKVELQ